MADITQQTNIFIEAQLVADDESELITITEEDQKRLRRMFVRKNVNATLHITQTTESYDVEIYAPITTYFLYDKELFLYAHLGEGGIQSVSVGTITEDDYKD